MATVAEVERDTETIHMTIRGGTCLPHWAGGCGSSVGAIEDEAHYRAWLSTGMCPSCQGVKVHDHHAPAGCY